MASRLTESRGGFSLDALRFPLAALGIFGVLAGLGAWLVQGDFSLIPRILIAGGVLLLGIYVALDPEDVWAKLTGRGALASGNTVLIARMVARSGWKSALRPPLPPPSALASIRSDGIGLSSG